MRQAPGRQAGMVGLPLHVLKSTANTNNTKTYAEGRAQTGSAPLRERAQLLRESALARGDAR